MLVEDPYRGRAIFFKEDRQRQRNYQGRAALPAATDTHAEEDRRWRVFQRDLHGVGARRRIGDRSNLPYHSFNCQPRVRERPNNDLFALGAVIDERRLGDIEHGVLIGQLGELHHSLARADILARFGADGGNDAIEIGFELGIVELVAGQIESSPGGGKLGLGGAQIAQRDVVARLRRPAVLQELAEPGLGQL